jgi:NAD(P)-dependent dehydrogenase (short-subunit alcohol dehydrogenase family)
LQSGALRARSSGDSVRRVTTEHLGAVVITGTSTGIGEATARHLEARGFRVFAGVRKGEDGERLRERSGERLTPLKLDVTDADSITSARAEVEEAVGDAALAGLVNNAGISVTGPVEFIPIDELRRQLEVNLVGQVAVIQAFLPALRAARGRIVNISSIGGRIALPLLGPYAASKFALEGLSDSLRRELRPHRVNVVLVEPGSIRTAIWEKGGAAADELMEGMPPEVEELYGDLIKMMRAEADKRGREGLDPIEVARVIERALTAAKPRTRYLVGRDAKMRARASAVLPDRTFDALIERALSR